MKLKIPVVLRRYSNDEAEAEVEGATVSEALEDLFRLHSDLRTRVLDARGRVFPYILVFVNEASATLETAVGSSDTIELVGAAEGG